MMRKKNRWGLVALLFLLSGCVAAPAQPTVPAATPTERATLPAPTPTAPEPTPTPTALPRPDPTPTMPVPPAAPVVGRLDPAFPDDMVELEEKPLLLRQARLVATDRSTGDVRGTVEHLRLPQEERLRLSPDFRLPGEGQFELILTEEPDPTLEDLVYGHPLARLLYSEGAQEYVVPGDLKFRAAVLYDRDG